MPDHTYIKSEILRIFQGMRENPESDFEESNLFGHLAYPPQKPSTLMNSFKGSKMYRRFIQSMELEFGICFKRSDLHRYYSLSELVKKVSSRINSPKGNRIILSRRIKQSKNYHIEWTLIVILMLLFFAIGLNWIFLVVFLVWICVMIILVKDRLSTRQHLKKLKIKLDSLNHPQLLKE